MKFLVLMTILRADTLILSMDDAVKRGLEYNYLILASKEQVKIAEAQKNQARSVFFPQVKLDASYRRVSLVQEMKSFQVDSLVMVNPGVFIPMGHSVSIPFGQKDNYSINLGVSQAFFTWGTFLRTYKISLINLRDKILSDSMSNEQLAIEIRRLYTLGLILREFVDLSKKVDEELYEHYITTKSKYEAGTATEIELLQAESKYKNNKVQILDAERQYQEIIDLLKVMLNIDPETVVVLTDSLKLNEDYFHTLLNMPFSEDKRYDIRSLDYKLKILDLTSKNYASANLPTFFYSFNILDQKPFGFENIWKNYWALTLGVSFPIFDGLKASYQVREVKYQKKALEYQLAFQRRNSTMEYEKALRNLRIALEKYETQKENLKVAQKLYETVKTQYEQGLATNLDFIDAETNYFAQRAYMIQALGNCILQALDLEKAIKGIK